MSDYDDPREWGEHPNPDAIEEAIADSIQQLLEGIGEYAEFGNNFAVWAEENGGMHPLAALTVFQTIYVFLRSYLPEDQIAIMLSAIISFVEHLAEDHPGTFYHTTDDGEELPAPFVKPGEDFGAGQAMLRALKEAADGAS